MCKKLHTCEGDQRNREEYIATKTCLPGLQFF